VWWSLRFGTPAKLNIKVSTMDNTYELGRKGLTTTLTVKDHDYDVVEFTMRKHLTDESGKVIVDSKYQMFFSNREFRDFFQPVINDLKVRFDNANSIQE
jgi:hypothetical protein